MKLFLASSLDKTMPLLFQRITKPAKEVRVLFIENAADFFTDKWWVTTDREAFLGLGCKLVDIDLREISKGDFLQHIANADILHMCGGSVVYLLSLIKQKGFDEIIVSSVRENKILYTGTSAGSIIVAPSVDLFMYQEKEANFAKKGMDFTGLGLVSFLILPHINNPESVEGKKNMFAHLSEYSRPILLLHDSQAVWVEDDKFELVSVI